MSSFLYHFQTGSFDGSVNIKHKLNHYLTSFPNFKNLCYSVTVWTWSFGQTRKKISSAQQCNFIILKLGKCSENLSVWQGFLSQRRESGTFHTLHVITITVLAKYVSNCSESVLEGKGNLCWKLSPNSKGNFLCSQPWVLLLHQVCTQETLIPQQLEPQSQAWGWGRGRGRNAEKKKKKLQQTCQLLFCGGSNTLYVTPSFPFLFFLFFFFFLYFGLRG